MVKELIYAAQVLANLLSLRLSRNVVAQFIGRFCLIPQGNYENFESEASLKCLKLNKKSELNSLSLDVR